MQCIKALVHLQQQFLIQREDGTYVSDLLFDQLTMLAKCLPILLLVGKTLKIVRKRSKLKLSVIVGARPPGYQKQDIS